MGMPDRNLKIVRFIGSTPSVAYCDVCKLAFKTRQEFLVDPDQAIQQLQSDFAKHECKPEDGAVSDALNQIR
jgi:heterodisulfide reductase subunit B